MRVPSSDGILCDIPHTRVGAVVVAAGESRRMGVDKIFMPLAGRPLISYSLQVLNDSPLVDAVVLVMSASNVERGRKLVSASRWKKVREVCAGGPRRQDSVKEGLIRLNDCQWIIVQDGARPFIDQELAERGLVEARQTGASTAAVPVKDTIKSADASMTVTRTVPREGLWSVQTPQVFQRELLVQAHQSVTEDVTDDASMIERIGCQVRLFMGSYDNIKVTTPEDLPVAEAILSARANLKRRGTR